MNSTPSRLRSLFLLLALVPASACVTQQRYDEVMDELKFYQRAYADLESFQGKLEAENEDLKGRLDLAGSAGTMEASSTVDLDERMQQLEEMASRLGGPSGDVEVIPVEGGYGLRVTDSILFDSGSAEIRPEGKSLLLGLASEIGSRPYRRIWVRGHTDTDPIVKPETKRLFPRGNLELATERALVVADLLGSQGSVDSRRIVVAGFGPAEPVVPNDSAANKQRNRRVEIFVLDQDEDEGASSGQK